MSFHFNVKKKQREYMKYEDGKVVPVNIEENNVYHETDLDPHDEVVSVTEVIKETASLAKEKSRSLMTTRTLKVIGAIVFLVLFGFALKDIYYSFFTAQSQATTPQGKTHTHEANTTPIPRASNNTPSKLAGVPGATDNRSSNTGMNNLKAAISAANTVNNVISTGAATEITYLNGYLDNKVNMDFLTNEVTGTLDSEQQASVTFGNQSSLFTGSDLSTYYATTNERLGNAMTLSRNILSVLSGSGSQTVFLANEAAFAKQETSLKNQQNSEFAKILMDNQIPYTTDAQNHVIHYLI